jgi:hypothetical protein
MKIAAVLFSTPYEGCKIVQDIAERQERIPMHTDPGTLGDCVAFLLNESAA